MYLLAACQSYFSLHLPPKTRFSEYGSLLLIGQFEERNAELEWAAVSGEDRCVMTLITAGKETTSTSSHGSWPPPPRCLLGIQYPTWNKLSILKCYCYVLNSLVCLFLFQTGRCQDLQASTGLACSSRCAKISGYVLKSSQCSSVILPNRLD